MLITFLNAFFCGRHLRPETTGECRKKAETRLLSKIVYRVTVKKTETKTKQKTGHKGRQSPFVLILGLRAKTSTGDKCKQLRGLQPPKSGTCTI